MTPGIEIKIPTLYCTSTRHTKSYPRVSFVYSLKYMEFKWQDLYDRKRHCLILIWPKGAKWKFQILTAHMQDMSIHILEYELSTPENVDVVKLTNITEKTKRRISTLIWPLRIKWKFRNLIAHLQYIPNHILEYQLSILWIEDRVPVTTTSPKTSFIYPHYLKKVMVYCVTPVCPSVRPKEKFVTETEDAQ